MGRARRAYVFVVLLEAGLAGCSLLTSVDGFSGGAVAAEAGPDGSSDADVTSSDAPVERSEASDEPDADAGPDVTVDADADAETTTYTIFADSVPAVGADIDKLAVELGVKFTVNVPGHIVGIRFFRAAPNPSGYTVRLWVSGTLLTSASVPADDTTPGWREQRFSPVPVLPGTVYVASYWTSNGAYAVTLNGLRNSVSNGPLRALADGAPTGGNGVFRYGPLDGGAPSVSGERTNYFVDVLFVASP